MKLLETRTRRCYSETFDDLDSNAFVKMMLLDGCFVLEHFLKKYERNWNSILEIGWNYNFIVPDLLLSENQIPFFIVEKLYEIGLKQEIGKTFVNPLVHNVAHKLSQVTGDSIFAYQPPAEIHHLVHLYYHYLVPNPEIPVIVKGLLHRFCFPNSIKNISSMLIPCATELKQKGLKLKPKSNPKHMLDISFEYGVLKIPKLEFVDETKPIFANLIAFESSKYGKENKPFTSFVYFLDNLVNTPNDVTILQECGIIENWLGSEEELTHFLNQVTEGGIVDQDNYLADLKWEVNRYIGSSWNRQRAKLVRDYFSSPWSAISLVAALILLVLTCVQSFYAVYAYKFPPSS